MTIFDELSEAESALAASCAAVKTHGHQSITWALLKADGARVNELRAQLTSEQRVEYYGSDEVW